MALVTHAKDGYVVGSLNKNAAKDFGGVSLASSPERPKTTIGIDVHDVKYLNVMKKTDLFSKLELTVWDFAGQLEYSVNHQVCSKTNFLLTISIFSRHTMSSIF